MLACAAARFASAEVNNYVCLHSSPSGQSHVLQPSNPLIPGHLCVLPEAGVSRLAELSVSQLSDLMSTVSTAQDLLRQSHGATAFNLACKDGADAGQPFAHVHWHVVPRTAADFEGKEDAVYPLLAAWSPLWPASPNPSLAIDSPGGRRANRSMEAMEDEAQLYRAEAARMGRLKTQQSQNEDEGGSGGGEGAALETFLFGPKIRVSTQQLFHSSPNGLSVAFVNLNPFQPGHVLVSPRRSVQHLFELTDEERDDLWATVRDVQAIVCAARPGADVGSSTAAQIGVQDGRDAEQSVPHVHCHIVPAPL